jgi:hypothetical protein
MADDETPYIAAHGLSRAYDHLRSNRAIQLNFPPQTPPHSPRWLPMLLLLFRTIQPALTVVLVVALTLAILGLIFVLVRNAPRNKKNNKPAALVLDAAGGVDWRPEAVRASILLQDADRLASERQFAEAVHLLLLRSVQDIQGRHPGLVRPAFTSRDIAQLDALSQQTRVAFVAMAEVVEHSVFGGRSIGAETFARCRQIYEGFAFPPAWRRGETAS